MNLKQKVFRCSWKICWVLLSFYMTLHYTSTVKPHDILNVQNALAKSVHCAIGYSACSLLSFSLVYLCFLVSTEKWQQLLAVWKHSNIPEIIYCVALRIVKIEKLPVAICAMKYRLSEKNTNRFSTVPKVEHVVCAFLDFGHWTLLGDVCS